MSNMFRRALTRFGCATSHNNVLTYRTVKQGPLEPRHLLVAGNLSLIKCFSTNEVRCDDAASGTVQISETADSVEVSVPKTKRVRAAKADGEGRVSRKSTKRASTDAEGGETKPIRAKGPKKTKATKSKKAKAKKPKKAKKAKKAVKPRKKLTPEERQSKRISELKKRALLSRPALLPTGAWSVMVAERTKDHQGSAVEYAKQARDEYQGLSSSEKEVG